AGPAVAAIAVRVLRQILLVIILGKEERRRVGDLGGDGAVTLGGEFLLVHRLRGLGCFFLLRREGVDGGAVLCADVGALAHALRRVVALPERLEQGLVGNLLRVVHYQHHLVLAGLAG